MNEYNKSITAVSPNGHYIGFEEHGIIKYYGIKYANVERWKKPLPITTSSNDIIKACQYGPSPWQVQKNANGELLGNSGLAEDSLNLNLFTADLLIPDKSVMVWITGGAQIGGNNIGFQSQTEKITYDPSIMVTENPDIIVVTINYRLGFWGSVNLSCLEGCSPDYQYSNNLARLDILECLKWIKKNISAFGGNPENITLFGQSAGSNNITSLLLMPQALPYFNKAICQSSFSLDINEEVDPSGMDKFCPNR